jgi:hypothetical protein
MLGLGCTLLWRLWNGGATDLLTALVLLVNAVGLLGCGVLGLVPAWLLQRLQR